MGTLRPAVGIKAEPFYGLMVELLVELTAPERRFDDVLQALQAVMRQARLDRRCASASIWCASEHGRVLRYQEQWVEAAFEREAQGERIGRLLELLDFEPKVLLSPPAGAPGWWNLDVTPTVTYSPRGWLDLLAEVATGYTQQTDDVNSVEVTPRVGATWHLLSRDIPGVIHARERPPHRRVVIRDTMRVEKNPKVKK